MLRTPRYGKKNRDLYNKALEKKKQRYICPRCKMKKLVRVSYAVWECKKCGFKMAGGAYTPFTETGEIVLRMLGEIQ
ncbi:MAG: 50S ribosomal protein L37ae [Candidatus Micrarchaeota archaeon]|nr:50S ribosomal protein L37ae [Candidatus Micrarchaeota archaeon]